MILNQGSYFKIQRTIELNNEFGRSFYTWDFIQALKWFHKYDFYLAEQGLNKILILDYSKEVEKHLSEINYLGI